MDEKSLRIKDPLFQHIIDTLPVLLFWTDTNHIILGNNKLHATFFGFSTVEEVIGLSLNEWGKHAKFDQNFIDDIYATHNEIMQSKRGRVIEYVRVMPSNQETVHLSHKDPLLDKKGNVIGLIGISVDITELRNTQNQLIKAKLSTDKIFQNIIDALPVLLFWTDKNHVYLGNNERHALAFGFHSSQEIIGKTLYDSFIKVNLDAAIADRISKEHQEIMNTKKGQVLEYTVNLFDSDRTKPQKTYLSQKYPLFDVEDEVIGLIGISMDITELKHTQKALEREKEKAEIASASKSEFIANMSHDLRTPMTGVMGMLQGLLYEVEDAEKAIQGNRERSPEKYESIFQKLLARVREYATIAQTSSHELIDLLNEILETVGLESGKLKLTTETFNLYELVQMNINLLQSVAKHKKLIFSSHINLNIPPYLKGNRFYLDRCLLNILSNALKFTEQGEVNIDIDIKDPKNLYQKEDEITLIISVKDTGLGIPKDKFNEIFEHFSRLTSSYQGVYKGSGLGLYSVKQYVQAMGGKITVESEFGKGSCFVMTLTFFVSDQADLVTDKTDEERAVIYSTPKPLHPSQNIIESKILEGIRAYILVVEDNMPAAMTVGLYLEKYNCQVDIAKDGREALEKATTENYDLIFVDVGLPDFDGTIVTRRIRQLSDKQKSQVPIIALTGHAGNAEKCEVCFAAGMQAVLCKPVQPLTLKNVLEKWIRQEVSQKSVGVNKSDLKEKIETLPVIDWEGCLAAFDQNEGVTKKIVATFAKELKINESRLAEFYEKKDMEALCDELHHCLGGVVYLKLPQLENALRNFQAAINMTPQNQETLEETYSILQTAFHDFWKFMSSEPQRITSLER